MQGGGRHIDTESFRMGSNQKERTSNGINEFCMMCRDMFGACLREEDMVDLVAREVAGATAKAPALSFLAAIARDHGAMPQALQLFRFSLSLTACLWGIKAALSCNVCA